MSTFPLRIYLKDHSAVYAWGQLPPLVRSLFAGPQNGAAHAEFFAADPTHQRSYFTVSQISGDRLVLHRADVIAIQVSELAILIRFRSSKTKPIETTAIMMDSIEAVGFHLHTPKQKNP